MSPPAYTVLLDAPDKPVGRIQIAKLGDFKDSRYGDFSITAENVENWQRNLSQLPGGEALIDFEHRSERAPRDSKAAGWITGIDLDGDKVMADARWTPDGEQAIKNEVYRFFSPVYGDHSTETGDTIADTLKSGALTNKPFLGSMPGISLASDERVSEALDDDPAARFYTRALDGALGADTRALVILDVPQAVRDRAKASGHALPDGSYPIENAKQLHAAAQLAASGHGDVKAAKTLIRRRAKDLGVDVNTLPGFAPANADSRALTMNPELIKLLGLDENADDAKILEAATALKEQADKADVEPAPTEPAEPTKTLDQQAADEGKIVLDAADYAETRRKATAGETAMKQLHEQRFETAFDKALTDRKVAPAEKDGLHELFEVAPDATIKSLDARETIVPAKPAGAPSIDLSQADADPNELVAHGIHPDGHQLDTLVRAKLAEKGLPMSEYPKLLDQFMTDGMVG